MRKTISRIAVATVLMSLIYVPATQAKVYDESGTALDEQNISKGMFWFDFNEEGVIVEGGKELISVQRGSSERKNEGIKLSVGMVYEKELSPGYKIRGEIIELKPLMDNERNMGNQKYSASSSNRITWGPIEVVAKKWDTRYSNLKKSGLKDPGHAFLGPDRDGGNVGLKMRFTATNNNRAVKPTIIVADGEEAGPEEVAIFKTTGTGWQLLADYAQNENRLGKWRTLDVKLDKIVGKPDSWLSGDGKGITYRVDDQGNPFDPEKWRSIAPKETGLGTDTIGPLVTSLRESSAPVFGTTATDAAAGVEVGFYVNSFGMQDVIFGAIIPETGDAPTSYGNAYHLLQKTETSYLGRVKPDIDGLKHAEAIQKVDWLTDDQTDTADENIAQLHAQEKDSFDPVLVSSQTYEMPIHVAKVMEGTKVAGWIDFNNNGKFDENERSAVEEVAKTGAVNLKFTDVNQKTLCVDKMGVRVRVVDETDPNFPTAVSTALSGEVEDFQIPVICPPVGSKETTSGPKGQTQRAKVAFTAHGKQRENINAANVIDENVDVKIVNKADELVSSLTIENEGTYSVSGDGTVTFKPLPDFTGKGTGVSLRATDVNGVNSGWTPTGVLAESFKPIEGLSTMDGFYQPTVTSDSDPQPEPEPENPPVPPVPDAPQPLTPKHVESKDIQGAEQTGTPTFARKDVAVTPSADRPAKLIDPATGEVTDALSVPALENKIKVGTYTLNPETGKVTFQPEAHYVGTVAPAKVQVTDERGQTAIGHYTPTVVPVVPVGNSAVSIDVQGVPQTVPVKFAGENSADAVNFTAGSAEINGELKTVALNPSTVTLLNAEGEPAETVVVEGQGSYKLNEDKTAVVFTPEPQFTGKTSGVRVRVKDKNGTNAETTYTPEVTPVKLTSIPAETLDIQGETQKGKPEFASSEARVTFKPEFKLKSETGTAVIEMPAKDTAGNVVGSYTVNQATGEVTFVPHKDYTGAVPVVKATVIATATNGMTIEDTYQPVVKPVVPVGNPAVSIDVQGVPQTVPVKFAGENSADAVNFTAGSAEINGELKTVALNPSTVTLLNAEGEPAETVVVEGQGSYKLNEDKTAVVFTPEPQFTGKTSGVRVRVKDKNGTNAETTYTPEVTPAPKPVQPEPEKPFIPEVRSVEDPGSDDPEPEPEKPQPDKPTQPVQPEPEKPSQPADPAKPTNPKPEAPKPQDPEPKPVPEPGVNKPEPPVPATVTPPAVESPKEQPPVKPKLANTGVENTLALSLLALFSAGFGVFTMRTSKKMQNRN